MTWRGRGQVVRIDSGRYTTRGGAFRSSDGDAVTATTTSYTLAWRWSPQVHMHLRDGVAPTDALRGGRGLDRTIAEYNVRC